MSETITREELRAMLDVQSKNTEQMVLVAGYLKEIAEDNKKILDKMSNGMPKAICEALTVRCIGHTDELDKTIKRVEGDTNQIARDTFWIKIIFGSIAFITAIAIVIGNLGNHVKIGG